MNICKKCGVELDVTMNYCPLCGQKSNISLEEPIKEETYDFQELSNVQKRKIFWDLSLIILIAGMLTSTVIDLIINKNITWSKYTITVCLSLVIHISLVIFLHARIIPLLLSGFTATSLLMVLLDWMNKSLDWSLTLGIPLLLSLYLIIFVLFVALKRSRQKGVNLIAYVLLAVAAMGICTEGIIALHVHQNLILHWSLILLVCIVAVSAILLFIHYRLKKATDLRRFFHI
ncbi:MAG: DUF6320 domain-containing protein [Bacteroidales bacterium]|jgi:lysylphosphatidylglycerol synthetase-like protein (DUF2156 family)|nr:DUF6320 domain-containing protein [Bacteroidales bacterium]MDD2264936.1 DUF6320 domain-containing protein [Bacteroidales bacterium]MDD2831930.1 DUF6320 domain-containing protein [Bacteroidales bacterium]MDD3209358.1 DUF6320 domain-containing protein [Bacteroidales bacterium]MDD3698024.1 DUF6320 domain-containing protein [Bacteroidales bacterium]